MRFSRPLRPLALLLLVLAAGCDSPSGSTEGDSLDWLRDNAVPFATTAPGGSFSDLAPLGQTIGNARIVGLGEATHGSREFFQMKHRVLEYLVRERGFRTFGIEATWAEANRINRYVHTGEGDPAVLLSNLYFWTWNTREVLDMIQWMRAYNQSVPESARVSFYGFDMQYSRVAMDDVEAYLRALDPAAADSASAWYACYRRFQDDIPRTRTFPSYTPASAAVKAECRAGVTAAYGLLDRRENEFVPRSGRLAYETALRTARVVVQNEDLRASANQGAFKRDTYMAENAAWLAEVAGPGAGVVLWAHNAHVARLAPWMGTHLTERFGAGYVVVGFSFNSGGLNAVDGSEVQAMEAPAAVEGSYEYEFNRLEHARFIVDLRPLRAGNVPRDARWLLGPRPFRMIGAVYGAYADQEFYDAHELPLEYDLMIHLSQVTPTQRLPFRYE